MFDPRRRVDVGTLFFNKQDVIQQKIDIPIFTGRMRRRLVAARGRRGQRPSETTRRVVMIGETSRIEELVAGRRVGA